MPRIGGPGNPRYKGGPDPEVGRLAKRSYKRRNRGKVAEAERIRRRKKYATDPAYRAEVGRRRKALYLSVISTPTDQACAFCRSAPARLTSKYCSRKCRYAHSSDRQYRGGPSRAVTYRIRLARRRAVTSAAKVTGPQIRAAMAEMGDRCLYCGVGGGEVDHVIPIARGGGHEISNLAPACRGCNRRKNRKTPSEFLKRSAPWIMDAIARRPS